MGGCTERTKARGGWRFLVWLRVMTVFGWIHLRGGLANFPYSQHGGLVYRFTV